MSNDYFRIVSLDNKDPAVAVVPVSTMLNMKLIAKAVGAKKASRAAVSDMELWLEYVSE